MKVLVTGATGFTGTATVPKLLDAGVEVKCLVRPSSDKNVLPDPRIEWVEGDVEDQDSLVQALEGVDALVNIVSLGFGHAPNIVQAAQKAGIKRAIFVSTTALFTTLNASSKIVRGTAEELIMNSGLNYTVLRPTMIYGTPRDRNMIRLVKFVQRWPLIPIFGDGNSLQQPVYVGDVASAIVLALQNSATTQKAYNISGKTPLTYNEVIDTVCQTFKCGIIKLHIPPAPFVAILRLLEHLPIKLPLKAEQIERLNEDKAFDHQAAANDFGYEPLSFAQGIELEYQSMQHG